ncbi:hypothetical protein GCM10009801_20220 [Streptomyces albiaxialis]|uniref:Probable transposase IS891/IS1136/IS1341 domain-containing protein n=1 Tax=Streptomyces albiaxialis TaxID=329523 RepID=A0ABN2VVD1_9ACTN
MAIAVVSEAHGHVRWTFRLRVSSTARTALTNEWDRCRWVWNECVAETGRVIGIDWGVQETATTTGDGYDLPHAAHGRKAQAKPARYDRMMARRRPKKGQAGSRGYGNAKRLRVKAHKKVARQRRDTGRRWAKSVVPAHDALPVPAA